jgi:hypothetical protein
MLNEELTAEQKLLARYTALTECVSNNRYPGCLFIAACTFIPTLTIRSTSWRISKNGRRMTSPTSC